MWTLTYTVNEYDQQGEYLICVFDSQPSASDLLALSMGHLDIGNNEAHCLANMGIYGGAYIHYYLREVTSGEINPSVLENWR
jgi:hypothetical protein